MADKAREKGMPGGKRTNKTKVVSVRFDPELLYMTEVAARKQRRSVANFIEWAVSESLDRVHLTRGAEKETVSEARESLWHVDDAARLVRLARRYPDLLNHEEQLLCQLLEDNTCVLANPDAEMTFEQLEDLSMVRKLWPQFEAVASGKMDEIDLANFIRQEDHDAGRAPRM